jgi:hypothetical protein
MRTMWCLTGITTTYRAFSIAGKIPAAVPFVLSLPAVRGHEGDRASLGE